MVVKMARLYTMSKRDDVFMIKYINGDKDVFNDESRSVVQEENSSSKYIAKSPAANNAELIRKYKPEDTCNDQTLRKKPSK